MPSINKWNQLESTHEQIGEPHIISAYVLPRINTPQTRNISNTFTA